MTHRLQLSRLFEPRAESELIFNLFANNSLPDSLQFWHENRFILDGARAVHQTDADLPEFNGAEHD